ncbi:TonB-dependent receptor [Pontibacter sp. G13]|uniref:TonB-dependent receptor n=1 Tax=Pontibacter sp. G13 TaxID=3074898 RepID=UPI002889EE6E|nr:TonB-dependent receptor [Pontibacter sp. G13]WNJ16594.1 TonB-dependent receptor [Pontibacter sp. G13]
MNRIVRFALASCFALLGLMSATYAQGTIQGKLVDGATEDALLGARVSVEGTTTGAISDETGFFSLKLKAGSYVLNISYIGFQTISQEVTIESGKTTDLGTLSMEGDGVGVEEVNILASVAVDRKTPVAVSTVSAEFIEEKLGNQEFPEVFNTTPGVYATRQGGAFGDSRINLRGFNSRNVAVMINGVPVNDMENGWVYWSNWAGLADVTRSTQIQRGLGASKVAVPSIGGTINIMTKTTDMIKGGSFYYGMGNDGMQKMTATVSTGKMENGWAVTGLFGKTFGDGWVDGTQFEGYSYFFNISKIINDNHTVSLTGFGAPQWHGQRNSKMTIARFREEGLRFNENWGYKNGEEYWLRKNFYHKPQFSLNHYWSINDKTSLSTAAYYSFGTGGGTGPYGNSSVFYSDEYKTQGVIDFDKIAEMNAAQGALGSASILRASRNDHNWIGVLSTADVELNENWTILGGIDARYYRGEHYREVVDLLGNEYFVDDSDDNLNENGNGYIVRVGDKVNYNNDGEVRWGGVFAQAEYSNDRLSAFASGSLNSIGMRRTEYFNIIIDPETNNHITEWVNFVGFMAKGGANYNLDARNNVFANVGYFEKGPLFDNVFLNFSNNINQNAANEKILSFELGYGYRSKFFNANVNIYRTSWNDKAEVRTFQQPNGENFVANLQGVDALHQGVEIDFVANPINNLTIRGMASLGDWTWTSNLSDQPIFNEDQVQVGTINLLIDGLKVGDAAQTRFSIGGDWEVFPGLKVGTDFFYNDNLYADFDAFGFEGVSEDEVAQPWQIPAHYFQNLNASYRFPIGKLEGSIFGNVNNMWDTEYIAEADNNPSLRGANSDSYRVYYGVGRTWSLGFKVRF